MASHLQYRCGAEVGNNEPWTVVCKYNNGQGVGTHTDSDYESTCGLIVSLNLVGKAQFGVVHPKTGANHEIRLQPGDIVVFDRNLQHGVGPSEGGERINATIRFSKAPGKFLKPK